MSYPNLSAEIARHGLTYAELAPEIGTTPQTICNWITGKAKPGVDKAMATADFFGTTPEYLFAPDPIVGH